MPDTGDGANFFEGEIAVIEFDDYDGPYTTDVVIVKESFNYTKKWKEWDTLEGKKHRSPRKFCEWLFEKGIFESINYNRFSMY
jgi:hypothetical protein